MAASLRFFSRQMIQGESAAAAEAGTQIPAAAPPRKPQDSARLPVSPLRQEKHCVHFEPAAFSSSTKHGLVKTVTGTEGAGKM